MRTALRGLIVVASIILIGAAAQGATVSTTLTVNGSGTLSGANISASGTVTLSGIGSGTLSSSFSLVSAATSGSAPLTLTITTGSPGPTGTLTGTVTGSASLLVQVFAGSPSASGPATVTITTGTGGFAGTTGTFNVIASGQGAGSGGAGAGNFKLTGPGTLNIGGGGGGGGAAPSITAVQNNYSYILPGAPNYGIAPGALFIVKGSNLNNQPLSGLQSSASPGIPTTFNGASISVTVNGTTVTPGIYYTSPGQLAAVLPSNTPVGTGTITVTNGGQAGTPAPITVVQSALGIDTYYGTGTGLATVTDPNDATGQRLISPTNSLSPGQTFVLWGSGVGADTSNTDKVFPLNQNNLTSIPMQVWIGGIQAAIAYRGRSQYPGVDQVVVTVPQGVSPGCGVSVIAVSGSVVSNSVTIPVNPGGGTCSDASSPTSAGQISILNGKSNVHFGFLDVSEQTSSGKLSNSAVGVFYNYTAAQFLANSTSNNLSLGSCIINSAVLSGVIPTLPTGLDAGSFSVSGPSGTQPMPGIPQVPGFYAASTLPAGFIPANGGAFTFTGTGGADVGPIKTTVTYPTPLVWTNMPSITSVVRASGVPITWQAGAPGTYVVIGGSSSGGGLTVSFSCLAPVSAQQFTVPSYILLAMPAGSGSLYVENTTNPVTFTATNLDIGYAFASTGFTISPPYQ